jgi:hypothetical protein
MVFDPIPASSATIDSTSIPLRMERLDTDILSIPSIMSENYVLSSYLVIRLQLAAVLWFNARKFVISTTYT